MPEKQSALERYAIQGGLGTLLGGLLTRSSRGALGGLLSGIAGTGAAELSGLERGSSKYNAIEGGTSGLLGGASYLFGIPRGPGLALKHWLGSKNLRFDPTGELGLVSAPLAIGAATGGLNMLRNKGE